MQQASKPQKTKITPKNNLRDLALVEAALYAAGRPLPLKILARLVGTRSEMKIRTLVKTLMKEYENRNRALEILKLENDRFVLQLKANYTQKVRRLARRPLLTRGPLKTLSYIAFQQPIGQVNVIEVRGNHAYSHLKQLEELNLIVREGEGRKKVLCTTTFFADFFGLGHEPRVMKRQLKAIFDDSMTSESAREPGS